jgi:hypothetical protein
VASILAVTAAAAARFDAQGRLRHGCVCYGYSHVNLVMFDLSICSFNSESDSEYEADSVPPDNYGSSSRGGGGGRGGPSSRNGGGADGGGGGSSDRVFISSFGDADDDDDGGGLDGSGRDADDIERGHTRHADLLTLFYPEVAPKCVAFHCFKCIHQFAILCCRRGAHRRSRMGGGMARSQADKVAARVAEASGSGAAGERGDMVRLHVSV